MNKNFKFLLLFALILIGCDKDNPKQQQQKEDPPAVVGVYEAKSSDIPISFEFPAKISSKQDVFIVSKLQGTLQEQYFRAGDVVKKGQKLFLIEPDRYEATMLSAKATLGVAMAEFKRAELDFQRAKNLKDNNAISQKEYDATISAHNIAKAQVQKAEANLKNANIDLAYTVIKAPFDGVIGDPIKDIGSYINLSDPNLVRLTKLNPIDVDFSISEVDSLKINQKLDSNEWGQVGSFAKLHLNNDSNVTYVGKITFIDKVINNKTGTLSAKAEFDNNQSKLLPGSFARIRVDGFYQKNGFKIPQIAVQQDEVSTFVYVIKDGKVAKKAIKTSYETAQYAVVYDGIENKDKIIIDNFKKIRVGGNVVEAREKK